MLTRFDGIQIATTDPSATAARWQLLLGAEPDGSDYVECLTARRDAFRVGTGRVEFLQPQGRGPVHDVLNGRAVRLFGAVLATTDVDAMAQRLARADTPHVRQGDQLFLGPAALGENGLHLSIVPHIHRDPVGPLGTFYEVTNLVEDVEGAVERYTQALSMDRRNFVPIPDPIHGYDGVLTMFRPGHLDRLEVVRPYDPGKTMGRYWAKFGPSLYMAFAECEDIEGVERRAGELGLPFSRDVGHRARHAAFIHPQALGGVMLGISRPEFAWDWSGDPERVPARLRTTDDAQVRR